MFLRNFLLKTLAFLHFFLGGPLFCFLFFGFGPVKALFLSLGGPFLVYTFFFRPRPKPQSRGPLCFCEIFCSKHWLVHIFLLGGPLFCFLFFGFGPFEAFLSLGGPFLICTFFFRPRPKPKSRGPLCFCEIFFSKRWLFYMFSSGAPCFVSSFFGFGPFKAFLSLGGPKRAKTKKQETKQGAPEQKNVNKSVFWTENFAKT